MTDLIHHASAAQAQASDPAASVFVSANAGTGKTKLLTDRVLRLLLAGAPADSILCVTYTRAPRQKCVIVSINGWGTGPLSAPRR